MKRYRFQAGSNGQSIRFVRGAGRNLLRGQPMDASRCQPARKKQREKEHETRRRRNDQHDILAEVTNAGPELNPKDSSFLDERGSAEGISDRFSDRLPM
jgi:hypothetical protein